MKSLLTALAVMLAVSISGCEKSGSATCEKAAKCCEALTKAAGGDAKAACATFMNKAVPEDTCKTALQGYSATPNAPAECK